MSWTELSTGVYQRPLSTSESATAAAISAERENPREPIKIHCFSEFTAPYPKSKIAQAFRQAWKALRLLKDPSIASTFKDGQTEYRVPSSDELEAWLSETFVVPNDGKSIHDLTRDFRKSWMWVPSLFLLSQPAEDGTFRGTIVLWISHWRTEAAGSLVLINQLFDFANEILTGTATSDALSKHVSGSEAGLLMPAIEDILMPDQETTSEAKNRVEKHFSDYYEKLPSIDFPIQGTLSSATSNVMLNQHIYPEAASSELVKACKSKGISVTAAIHAAYLGAVWHIADPSKRNRAYASMMPAQVRTRLPASSPYRTRGCWSAAQMLMLTSDAGQDFLARAKGLGEQYKRASTPAWLHEDARETSARALMMPPEQASKIPAGAMAMPWFTSHGKLDGDVIVSDHGNFKVEKVLVWADPMGPGVVLASWTFRGKLNIEIHYNKAYHSDEVVKGVMDIIDATLKAELGLDIGGVEGVLHEF